MAPRKEWADIEDVIGSALNATESVLEDWLVSVDVAPDLPLLDLDFVLIERVFINLIENAAKFASPGNVLEIAARHRGDRVEVTVFISGSDIAPDETAQVFERFIAAARK